MSADAHAVADLDRRLANIISFGAVEDLDEANAQVRVRAGEILTDWLPWVTLRAGEDRTWWAPEPGEQVVILAPSGELAQAVVLPAIYQDAHPAPANVRTVHRLEYADGTFIEYDREAHHYKLSVAEGGNVTVICKQATVQAAESVTVDTPSATFTGDVEIQGNATVQGDADLKQHLSVGNGAEVTGDVTADGISLKNHTHTEQGDGAPTSPPN